MTDARDLGDGVVHERLVGDVADERAVAFRAEPFGEFGLPVGVEVDAGHEPAAFDELACQLIAKASGACRDDGDGSSLGGCHVGLLRSSCGDTPLITFDVRFHHNAPATRWDGTRARER